AERVVDCLGRGSGVYHLVEQSPDCSHPGLRERQAISSSDRIRDTVERRRFGHHQQQRRLYQSLRTTLADHKLWHGRAAMQSEYLSAMSSARTLAVEWFNPSTGATTVAGSIPAGSSSQPFTPPFGGDAVLYLVDSAGHAGSAVAPPASYRVTGLAGGLYRYRV